MLLGGRLGPPVVPFCPFLGEGSPTEIDKTERSWVPTLFSPPYEEDLGYLPGFWFRLRSNSAGPRSRLEGAAVDLRRQRRREPGGELGIELVGPRREVLGLPRNFGVSNQSGSFNEKTPVNSNFLKRPKMKVRESWPLSGYPPLPLPFEGNIQKWRSL